MERLFELETELRSATNKLGSVLGAARTMSRDLEDNVLNLQDLLLRLRYSTVELLFWRLKRAARDTAYHLGKDITVELYGTSVMLDRAILDRLGCSPPTDRP